MVEKGQDEMLGNTWIKKLNKPGFLSQPFEVSRPPRFSGNNFVFSKVAKIALFQFVIYSKEYPSRATLRNL